VASEFYDLLEVDPTATPEEIKRSYRRLARELHPDANPGDAEAEARFKEVSAAYEVLSDPTKRAQYDQFGDPRGQAGNPFGGGGGFQDIFDAFFSQMGADPGRRSGPQRGADIETSVVVDLTEAAFGVAKDLSARIPVACEDCGATGAAPGTTPSPCGECQGTGEIRRVRQSLLGQMVTASPCVRCSGTGAIIATPCPRCHGDGRVTDERTLSVDVPAGVEDGTTLRLDGRGAAGPRGGPPGSLYVHLRVTPDPRFERNGDDLHTLVHVSAAQAAIGTELDVDTLEAPLVVAIEPGTQSGAVLRQRNLGVTHLRGRGRGDLFIHVQVDTPTDLSEREVELLTELAAIRGEHLAPPEKHRGIVSKIRSAFS
jgi:molecular chaperone DnaJ